MNNCASQTARARIGQGAAARANSLRVTEVFHSIQGEALDVGWPSVFIRLTGCPLRCTYCDTAYAFGGGRWRTIDDLLAEVAGFGVRHVCVTGGEPLAQSRCHRLLERLADAGYRVSLETSGAVDIAQVDRRVSRIVDVKTPGSGECERNLLTNLQVLEAGDALKFVICDRADYDWAREFLARWPRIAASRCSVFFSPSHPEMAAAELAEWILADRLDVRLQVQLHKLLWGNAQGR